MYTVWTKHLQDQGEKTKLENSILSAKSVLDRLHDILEEDEKGLDRSESDIKTFDTPGWEFKQAYKNGYRACLNMLKTLVNLDLQKQL